jgi:hypothetical protein
MLWFYNANLREFPANLRQYDYQYWRRQHWTCRFARFYNANLREISLILAKYIKKLA